MSQTETKNENSEKADPIIEELKDRKSEAIRDLSDTDFDIEVKKEFGQKIKKTKTIEELQITLKGFMSYLAEKLKLKTETEKTPREESKLISEGKSDTKHIGLHSLETFSQELISLAQTTPEFRTIKWKKRCTYLKQALIESELKKSDTRPLLYEMERIENQR